MSVEVKVYTAYHQMKNHKVLCSEMCALYTLCLQ